MGLWRRKSKWQGVDFMSLRPEQIVDSRQDDQSGLVVLLLPRFRTGPFARWLQARLRPERAHIKVKLEERGSWLWSACDGEKTVTELAAEFREKFPEDNDQVDQRVCQYLYQLDQNRCIRFVNLT